MGKISRRPAKESHNLRIMRVLQTAGKRNSAGSPETVTTKGIRDSSCLQTHVSGSSATVKNTKILLAAKRDYVDRATIPQSLHCDAQCFSQQLLQYQQILIPTISKQRSVNSKVHSIQKVEPLTVICD
jgi:hypothetical protein